MVVDWISAPFILNGEQLSMYRSSHYPCTNDLTTEIRWEGKKYKVCDECLPSYLRDGAQVLPVEEDWL